MKSKWRGCIFTLIALCVMVSVVKSSSMTYQSQTLVPLLEKWVPQNMVETLFGWVCFSYAGKIISITTMGYASFLEFFIRKFAHFGTYFVIAFSWGKAISPLLSYKRKIYLFI